MKYMGSKARHAKEILPIILAGRAEGQWYVEPFVGGANVIDKVGGNRIGSDYHEYLIAFYKAISEGWIPPNYISKANYLEMRANKGAYPKELVGYAGFQLAYGAVWFSTYRNDPNGKRNYCEEAFNGVMKQVPKIRGVKFHHCSYDQLKIPENSIIYCDPPYAGTTGYATGSFDHTAFWQWCRDKVAEGHRVYVSEYTAPDDWHCVWQKEVNNTLTKDTGSKKGVEKLFSMDAGVAQGTLF